MSGKRWPGRLTQWLWIYVPAPTWPLWARLQPPPRGWRPPHDWPTPPGWRWRRMRSGRVALCVGLTVLVLGVAAETFTEHVTGQTLDPTDPMNFNRYVLVNDLGSAVYLRECSDRSCRTFLSDADWQRVESGQSDRIEVSWGRGATYTYAVAYHSATPVARCLQIAASTHAGTATITLSAASPCA